MEISLTPNERAIHSVSFPSETQAYFWKLRRSNQNIVNIAKNNNKSLPYISKALKITNKKIEKILSDMARTNMVQIQKISPNYGFALGFSPALNRNAYLTFSPATGAHIWYEHEGNCESCPGLKSCNNLLTIEAEERGLTFPSNLAKETEKAKYLFELLKNELHW